MHSRSCVPSSPTYQSSAGASGNTDRTTVAGMVAGRGPDEPQPGLEQPVPEPPASRGRAPRVRRTAFRTHVDVPFPGRPGPSPCEKAVRGSSHTSSTYTSSRATLTSLVTS